MQTEFLFLMIRDNFLVSEELPAILPVTKISPSPGKQKDLIKRGILQA